VGTTTRISPLPATDKSDQGLPTAQVSRDANGSVVINIQADAKNPLGPLQPVIGKEASEALEPGINPNLNVTLPAMRAVFLLYGGRARL
jgi:hypothetical protein